jgi:hypothetical protein
VREASVSFQPRVFRPQSWKTISHRFCAIKRKTYRVDEEKMVGKNLEHSRQPVLDLLLTRDTRRVDVVNTGTNLVGIAIMLEGIQKLHVTLRGLDRDDISIQAFYGWENIVKVRVTEVGMSLKFVGNTGGSQLEGIDSPLEICVPIAAAKRQLMGS